MEDYNARAITYEEAIDLVTSVVSGDAVVQQNGIDFFNDQVAQRDRFISPQYVYRRTRTLYTNTQVQATFTGVGQIWEAAQIVSFEGIPATVPFQLPGGEYLKLAPTVTFGLNQKNHITYEYWHADSWSRLYYEVYSG